MEPNGIGCLMTVCHQQCIDWSLEWELSLSMPLVGVFVKNCQYSSKLELFKNVNVLKHIMTCNTQFLIFCN